MRRFVPLAIALTALAVVPVQGASAAAANKCGPSWDLQTTDFTGTSKSEKFTLTLQKRVINAHGGNDIIEMGAGSVDEGTFLQFPATVCMGSGNDILRATDDGGEGVPIRYLDGGKGFDTAEVYICFEGDAGGKWILRDVERITVINCLD
jgi:hypothetical protein